MKTSPFALALALATPVAAGCHSQQATSAGAEPMQTHTHQAMSSQRTGVTERQAGSPKAEPEIIPVPPGSTMVGLTSVSEIRAFPETAGSGPAGEAAIGVVGQDRVYEVGESYEDTVKFYEQKLSSGGFRTDSHTTTQTATIWSAHAPDGSPVRVAVRNTNPPTAEIIEAAGAAAESPPR